MRLPIWSCSGTTPHRPSADATLSAAPRAPPPTGSTAANEIPAHRPAPARPAARARVRPTPPVHARRPSGPGPFRSSSAPSRRAPPARTDCRLRHAYSGGDPESCAPPRPRCRRHSKCRKEFLRAADAGERQYAAAAVRVDEAGIRLEPCVKHRDAARLRAARRHSPPPPRRRSPAAHGRGRVARRAARASGPAGVTRPLPTPRPESTTSSAKSLARAGF